MTKLSFGIDVTTAAHESADPVGKARRAEELGFDFVSGNDHPCGTNPTFELWTMLTWIAASTERIKVATRVLGVPYRAPAMVAKMAASLDQLSGGRLILGMGGGASDDEFRAFGLHVPSPREKVDGLEDAIRMAQALWTERDVTYPGRVFHTDGANVEPKPRHAIPIWLGTYGKRALDVTGRVADGWLPTLELALPEQAVVMRDRIFASARGAGRDPSDITLAYNLEVHLGASDDRPHVLSGSADEVAAALLSFVEIGFTAFNFQPLGPYDEQAEILARDVVPQLS